MLILRIHIRTSSQMLFHGFIVSLFGGNMNGKFCTSLAPVFAEEGGYFSSFNSVGIIKRCFTILILRIHIRTFSD